MARQPFRVEVDGLAQLRRDLKEIDRKLPRELTKIVRSSARPALAKAKQLAPKRTGALAASLRIGTSRGGAVIRSPRSGAGIIHYGGRHPLFGDRDHWYDQRPTLFITRAVAIHQREIERDLAAGIERLVRDAGFRTHH